MFRCPIRIKEAMPGIDGTISGPPAKLNSFHLSLSSPFLPTPSSPTRTQRKREDRTNITSSATL